MATTGFVVAGKVVRAHGLRGELGVISYADSPQLFQRLQRIYLKPEKARPKRYLLEAAREYGELVLVTLHGIASRQQAQGLIEAEVWVRKRDLPRECDDLLMADLIGWEVVLPDGSRLGRITRVQSPGGQELWSIEDEQAGEILFPAAEELIIEADQAAGKVVIDPPPGLLELYRNHSG